MESDRFLEKYHVNGLFAQYFTRPAATGSLYGGRYN